MSAGNGEKRGPGTGPEAGIGVAIQGEPGSFSHMAALRLLGEEVRLVPTRSFDDLFAAVVSGEADRGMVPVENTLAGSVQGNLDRILSHGLRVVSEVRVRIKLSLVAPPGRDLTEVRTAASHPVALQQCQAFFRRHPHIDPVAVYDTAGSIQDLMSGEGPYHAAIGSELAARIYGARTLLEEIEDDRENYTRFFAVAEETGREVTGAAKTSLAFVVSHEPGSLYRALGVFAEEGIDLTKLESRPIPGCPWEYRFYADVRGHPRVDLGTCLTRLEDISTELRVLGTYPEWEGEVP